MRLFLTNKVLLISFNSSSSSITYILLNNSNIFLAQCLLSKNKLLFWRVAVNTFKLTMVLLKWNGKMLVKWLSEQFWRCCIYVLIETADAEITASFTRVSVYVVNKTARLCHSFIHTETQNMQESYLNRLLRLNIYRYYMAIWFKCNDLLLINSSKLWQIPWHSVLNCKFRFYNWIPRFRPRFMHRGNHRAVRVKNRVDRVLGTTGTWEKLGTVTFSFF